jgi:hypothetical protein
VTGEQHADTVHETRSSYVKPSNATYFDKSHNCPDVEKHTAAPTGYLAWHEWAARKAKTHTQHRCPTCGFWVIWKRQRKGRR